MGTARALRNVRAWINRSIASCSFISFLSFQLSRVAAGSELPGRCARRPKLQKTPADLKVELPTKIEMVINPQDGESGRHHHAADTPFSSPTGYQAMMAPNAGAHGTV